MNDSRIVPVFQILAEDIHALGIRTVFGLMSDDTAVFAVTLDGLGVKFVGARHENNAIAMAEGYAYSTGRAGRGDHRSWPGHGERASRRRGGQSHGIEGAGDLWRRRRRERSRQRYRSRLQGFRRPGRAGCGRADLFHGRQRGHRAPDLGRCRGRRQPRSSGRPAPAHQRPDDECGGLGVDAAEAHSGQPANGRAQTIR